MKYIDAEKLRAEIERLYYNEAEKDESILAADAYKNALDAVEKFLNSLRQEQPEVELELEKEIDAYLKPIEAWQIQYSPFTSMENIARHFYQLGLNAKNKV